MPRCLDVIYSEPLTTPILTRFEGKVIYERDPLKKKKSAVSAKVRYACTNWNTSDL